MQELKMTVSNVKVIFCIIKPTTWYIMSCANFAGMKNISMKMLKINVLARKIGNSEMRRKTVHVTFAIEYLTANKTRISMLKLNMEMNQKLVLFVTNVIIPFNQKWHWSIIKM